MTEREPTFEDIDRVARAMYAAGIDPQDPSYGAIDEIARNCYRRMARAAILTLGEQVRPKEE
jgi:hypothetical protein